MWYHPPHKPRARVQLGFFDWLTQEGSNDDDLSPHAAAAFDELCCESGWVIKCELGSDVARKFGGSGQLAKASTPTVCIDFALGFYRDQGFSPPQGPVRLLRDSRYLDCARPGYWKLDADDDDGVPQTIQWRMRTCEQGLKIGDDQLVPNDIQGDVEYGVTAEAAAEAVIA